MTLLYIAIIILIVCVFICFSMFNDEDNEDSIISALKKFVTIIMILISICGIVFYTSKPTAIDVYQGKTTLEITYRDGVPVDSVVVWKGGEKW